MSGPRDWPGPCQTECGEISPVGRLGTDPEGRLAVGVGHDRDGKIQAGTRGHGSHAGGQ